MTEAIPQFSLIAAWTAAVSPLIAFGVILIFLRNRPRAGAAVSISAVAASLSCAVYLLVRHWGISTPLQYFVPWVVSGKLTIPIGALLDPLSLLMLVIVTLISFLVQVYSLGYMSGDPGYARYYAFMSLFAWAMISLVIAPAIIQLFIFWELVGIASYLLIGFWFEKFSASEAGKKAFIMTRLGDTAFLTGLILLLVTTGTWQIPLLNDPGALPPFPVTLCGLLILGGIIGKSAQFPLMTWLPDAMEGPTPVSALLHSATMVAAGIYLFARLFPFFSASEIVMTVALSVGAASMLMAATMAMVTNDIKKVWAFSTISQLGLMLMGLAAGGYFSGIFHLTAHAGFKALLFLCAGVLIHLYDTNDMFQIAQKGGASAKIPMICMTVGAAALSGIWPFSGFFSKEAVMAALAHLDNPIWLAAGLAGVFLTGYYTFRLIFVLWRSPSSSDNSHAALHHTGGLGYGVMAAPLVILALVTLVLGFFQDDLHHFILPGAAEEMHGPDWLAPVSLSLAAAALIIAWLEFGRKRAPQKGFVEKWPALARFFRQRWYLDHIYNWLAQHVVDRGIAALCNRTDQHVVDGFVHWVARGVVSWGRIAAAGHRVLIQTRLMVMFAVIFGLTVLVLFL